MPAFLSNHSKLVAAIVGNIVGLLIAWLAVKGLASCTGEGDAQVCSVVGFTSTDITTGIMAFANMAFVYFFPPNKP